MTDISRRIFLGGVGAGALAGFLTACSGPSPEPRATGPAAATGGAAGGAGIRWWDHFGGLQDLHAQWSADLSKQLGVPVEYSYNEPGKATEALQLANQSNQLPDIYSNILGL